MITGFIGRGSCNVIMKPPASTGAVNKMPEIIVPVGTLAHDAASFLVFPPDSRIDPRLGIEWRDHDIGSLAIAFGMIVIACAFQTNVSKCAWQRSVAEWRKGWIVHRFLPEEIGWCRTRQLAQARGLKFLREVPGCSSSSSSSSKT